MGANGQGTLSFLLSPPVSTDPKKAFRVGREFGSSVHLSRRSLCRSIVITSNSRGPGGRIRVSETVRGGQAAGGREGTGGG